MTTPPSPPRPTRIDPLRRWLGNKRNRALAAAALGGAVGLSCLFLPPVFQPACHLAAKILGLVLGSP